MTLPNGVVHLRQIFETHAQRACLIDGATGRELSYAQVARDTLGLATVLASHGVTRGDKICFVADNSINLTYLFWATWHCGATIVPLNPQLSKIRLVEIISAVTPKLVLIEQQFQGQIEGLTYGATGGPSVLCFDANGEDCDHDPLDMTEALKAAPLGDDILTHLRGGDLFMMVFTSGSTAAPKGVMLSLDRLLGNELMFCAALGIDHGSRLLNMFPMSYLAGTHNTFLLPASVGASVVISQPLGGANLFGFWDMIRERGISVLWFTATMLTMILRVDDSADMSWVRDQVKLGIVGMAPLQPAVQQQFEERYGFALLENYALSETAFISSHLPAFETDARSKGRILKGVTVEVRAEDATILADGEIGEIFVKTPYQMLGYLSAAEADLRQIKPDGFYTGDIGYVQSDELYLTGRKKDLIIRGGVNIAPSLVENEVVKVPEVQEAIVFGQTNDVYGEEVAAVIALTPGVEDFTQKKLREALKGKLPYFQQPKSVLFIHERLPRGLTGKIDKKASQQLLADAKG